MYAFCDVCTLRCQCEKGLRLHNCHPYSIKMRLQVMTKAACAVLSIGNNFEHPCPLATTCLCIGDAGLHFFLIRPTKTDASSNTSDRVMKVLYPTASDIS